MGHYRYSRWDGSQEVFPLHEDDLMEELSEHLMSQGDVSSALRAMVQRGVRSRYGDRLQGLQDFLQRVRSQRQQILNTYDLDSVLKDITDKLEGIVQKEREGISRRLEEARERHRQSLAQGGKSALPLKTQEDLLQKLEQRVYENNEFLSALPKDPAGAINQLRSYEFMDPGAKEAFDELVKSLQQRVADTAFKDISERLKGMTPEQIERLKEMVRDLNDMLREKAEGGKPAFDQFMQRWGDSFGAKPPQSLDELTEGLQERMSQMQSLLRSMSPQNRESLQQLLQSVFGDREMQQELAELADNLEDLHPTGVQGREFPFHGDEPVALEQAMELMEQLHKMDDLERQVRRSQQNSTLEDLDRDLVRGVLGEEAAHHYDQLNQLTEMLEQTGYIRKVGARYELTPKGMRRIGQKALEEIFLYLKKDRLGQHRARHQGQGGDRLEETKLYEFGDAFDLDLKRTLSNAIERGGAGVPVRMEGRDFEIHRSEQVTFSATVLMLDLSLSMAMRGNFIAAKKVALALDSLIRSQFPRDLLFIVGFSTYAREVKPDKMAYLSWDEFDPYTNIQHGLQVAQKLLQRVKGGTKQIILISDGEPTAHLEGGQLFLQYPPSPRTIRETLKEVKRCTHQHIVINTFMLDRNAYLVEFVEQLAKLNKGRVFYTTPDRLGQYILVDYLSSRRKKIVL